MNSHVLPSSPVIKYVYYSLIMVVTTAVSFSQAVIVLLNKHYQQRLTVTHLLYFTVTVAFSCRR